jgi:hypothetical protein
MDGKNKPSPHSLLLWMKLPKPVQFGFHFGWTFEMSMNQLDGLETLPPIQSICGWSSQKAFQDELGGSPENLENFLCHDQSQMPTSHHWRISSWNSMSCPWWLCRWFSRLCWEIVAQSTLGLHPIQVVLEVASLPESDVGLDPIVFSQRRSNTGTHFNLIEGSKNKPNCLL